MAQCRNGPATYVVKRYNSQCRAGWKFRCHPCPACLLLEIHLSHHHPTVGSLSLDSTDFVELSFYSSTQRKKNGGRPRPCCPPMPEWTQPSGSSQAGAEWQRAGMSWKWAEHFLCYKRKLSNPVFPVKITTVCGESRGDTRRSVRNWAYTPRPGVEIK